MLETVISLCSQCTGYASFSHTLADCESSYLIQYALFKFLYVMCVHHHQFWYATTFSVARPLLLPSVLGEIDVILDIAETTRINLLLSACIELWC